MNDKTYFVYIHFDPRQFRGKIRTLENSLNGLQYKIVYNWTEHRFFKFLEGLTNELLIAGLTKCQDERRNTKRSDHHPCRDREFDRL